MVVMRKYHDPVHKPPPLFCLMLACRKGGQICGMLWYMTFCVNRATDTVPWSRNRGTMGGVHLIPLLAGWRPCTVSRGIWRPLPSVQEPSPSKFHLLRHTYMHVHIRVVNDQFWSFQLHSSLLQTIESNMQEKYLHTNVTAHLEKRPLVY